MGVDPVSYTHLDVYKRQILFGRKKSYFVKCTLTLIGLYLGVLFWYFNVDYLGQPIQNTLVLAVCSLICISVLVALYRIPEQLCVNSQIEKLLYFPCLLYTSCQRSIGSCL